MQEVDDKHYTLYVFECVIARYKLMFNRIVNDDGDVSFEEEVIINGFMDCPLCTLAENEAEARKILIDAGDDYTDIGRLLATM